MPASRIALQAAATVGGLFLLVLPLILVGGRRAPDRAAVRRLWTAYGLEFLTVAFILVPAYLGGWPLVLAMLVLWLVTGSELCTAMQRLRLPVRRAVVLILGSGIVAAAGFAPSPAVFYAACAGAASLSLLTALGNRSGARLTAGIGALLVLLYPGMFLCHLLLLARLPGGFGLIFFLYAVAEVNDAFAMVIGTLFGRGKLCPRLSPNKTLEGSLAGIIAGTGIAPLISYAAPQFDLRAQLVVGLGLSIAAQGGDLLSSAAKRRARIKDYSNLLPVIGGALDVYDSLIFTAPLFYAIALAAGFGR